MKNLMTKNLVNGLVIAFLTLGIVSCSKDKDKMPVVKIKSISYTPNNAKIKAKKAFSSVVAKKTPKNANVTFTIKSIKKGKENYTNPKNGFVINKSSGKITLKENHSIAVGVYSLTVQAADLTATKKTTVYKVTVE